MESNRALILREDKYSPFRLPIKNVIELYLYYHVFVFPLSYIRSTVSIPSNSNPFWIILAVKSHSARRVVFAC